MFEIKISANSPAELTASLSALAAEMQASVPGTPQQAPPPPSPPIAAVPLPAPPVTTSQPPALPVTAAPNYTLDQIMTAGAALVTAGKQDALVALLGAFGVQAVTQLRPEQLGAFATEMRKLGAQI